MTTNNRGFSPVNNTFRKHQEEILLPVRKTQQSAGYDFPTPISFTLKPKEKKMIWMDFKAFMKPDEFLMVHIRSSLAIKYDISLANNTGIIDADYFSNPGNDGNIGVCLKNNGKDDVSFLRGDYLAQGIFTKYLTSEDYNSNAKRRGGFGSTNV